MFVWIAIILACANAVIILACANAVIGLAGTVAVGCLNAISVVFLYMGLRAGRFR